MKIKSTGKVYKFEEVENAGSVNSCGIYYWTETGTIQVGSHVEQEVVFNALDNALIDWPEDSDAELQCWWGMDNEGMLSVGVGNGIRKLAGVSVEKVE